MSQEEEIAEKIDGDQDEWRMCPLFQDECYEERCGFYSEDFEECTIKGGLEALISWYNNDFGVITV